MTKPQERKGGGEGEGERQTPASQRRMPMMDAMIGDEIATRGVTEASCVMIGVFLMKAVLALE